VEGEGDGYGGGVGILAKIRARVTRWQKGKRHMRDKAEKELTFAQLGVIRVTEEREGANEGCGVQRGRCPSSREKGGVLTKKT